MWSTVAVLASCGLAGADLVTGAVGFSFRARLVLSAVVLLSQWTQICWLVSSIADLLGGSADSTSPEWSNNNNNNNNSNNKNNSNYNNSNYKNSNSTNNNSNYNYKNRNRQASSLEPMSSPSFYESPRVRKAETSTRWFSLYDFACCGSPRDDAMTAREFNKPPTPSDGALSDLSQLELRRRLSDLLGLPGSDQPRSAAAAVHLSSIEAFGGDRSCFSRFLVARKQDVAAAETMLRNTLEFREKMGVNTIYQDPKALAVWNQYRPLWPMAQVLFTDDGSPVTYSRMAEFLRMWNLGIDEDKLKTVYMGFMEHSLRLQCEGRRRCGNSTELPRCYEVYDFQGISFSHVTALIGLRTMGRVLGIGQAHYPEMLRKAIFINLPSFAVDTFHAFVSRIMDPEAVRMKFLVLRGEPHDELCDILGLSRANVDKLFRSIKETNGDASSDTGVLGEPGICLLDGEWRLAAGC